MSRPSPSEVMPAGPCSSSTASRTATAQVSPTASLVSSIISRSSRTRFSRLPPYSSVAPVVARRQELEGQVVVPGIDIDDVEAGALGPLAPRRAASRGRRGCRPGPCRAPWSAGDTWQGCAEGAMPGTRVMRFEACEPPCQSSIAGQAAMGVDGLRRQRQRCDVVIVPQGQKAIGRIVRRRMNGAVFGADHAPAALGLDAAQRRARLRALPAHADGMRRLVEPVGRRDGTDPHRLEQNVVAAVSQPSACPLLIRLYSKTSFRGSRRGPLACRSGRGSSPRSISIPLWSMRFLAMSARCQGFFLATEFLGTCS